jgi:hypothetical protein
MLVWIGPAESVRDQTKTRMKLSLQYSGPLTSSSRHRNAVKQRIRTVFSPQLLGFCSVQEERRPRDLYFLSLPPGRTNLREGTLKGNRIVFQGAVGMQDRHCFVRLGKYTVIPLVTRPSNLLVSLHIHLYRREEPGGVIVTGGDLDNRLKTLFDALRMPHTSDEIPDDDPGADPRLFCLLEDDSLITEVTVETHRLFEPAANEERDTDVRLSVHIQLTWRDS